MQERPLSERTKEAGPLSRTLRSSRVQILGGTRSRVITINAGAVTALDCTGALVRKRVNAAKPAAHPKAVTTHLIGKPGEIC